MKKPLNDVSSKGRILFLILFNSRFAPTKLVVYHQVPLWRRVGSGRSIDSLVVNGGLRGRKRNETKIDARFDKSKIVHHQMASGTAGAAAVSVMLFFFTRNLSNLL